jgi:hypothetical protein
MEESQIESIALCATCLTFYGTARLVDSRNTMLCMSIKRLETYPVNRRGEGSHSVTGI